MREPQTWDDKGLLEDEPFLSAFKARQIASPPTRQCTGKDDDARRNNAIAKEIRDGNLLDIVQAWLNLAFRPHVNDRAKLRSVNANEPGTLNLFIQFYWNLSQDGEVAIRILEKERRRRGHEYALPDCQTQQGVSAVNLLKVKKAGTKQKRIKNNLIDEKTTARQCGNVSGANDVLNGALRCQPPPRGSQVGSIPTSLESNNILRAKEDVPSCSEREEYFSQSCPPYPDPTPGISETRDTCQIGSNPSTSPLSPDSQNAAAVCDLPKTRKRRQTTSDTRRVKHPRICPSIPSAGSESTRKSKLNKTASSLPPNTPNTYDSQGGLEAHPEKGKLPILEAAVRKTSIPPPPPKGANTELRHVSNNGQPLEKRTKSRTQVDSSQKKLKRQKNQSSAQSYSPSLGPSQADTQVSVFSSRKNLSVTSATCNPSNRGKCASTSRATHSTRGKQGPRQINGEVMANKKVDEDKISSDRLALLDKIKKPGQYSNLRFNRISKPETSQETEGKLQQEGPPVSGNNELPKEQGTSVPHIDGAVLQSPCATYAPSNSHKRLSSSFDTLALEGGDYTIAPREISIIRAEKVTAASHRETKRRKIAQEKITAEPVKHETTVVLAHKQFREKRGKRTEERGALKVESSEKPLLQSETHPAADRPPANETKQDGTVSNSRRRTSSSEDRQHKQQEVTADQKDSVPITVQPDPVKTRPDLPPKLQRFEQEASVSIPIQLALSSLGRGRPPKSKVLSSTLTAGMAVPFSEENVGIIKQERSISAYIPFPPAQLHDVHFPEEIAEKFWGPINIPRPELDRDMKEESIRTSLLAQEHGLVEDHPSDILPTHKPPLGVKPPIWAQSRQEVCETFDWFRSYQGGVYFAQNIVKGYLLSAFSSKRDRFEHGGRLIISHGGGKAESLHTYKGQTAAQPATDQLAQDKSVRALLDNYRNQRPLVLLIDDKYVLFPYDLGVRDMTYVVLGFYTIVHAWAEYQPANNETGRVVRYKFAFRWCDDQGSPWWLTDKDTYLSDLTPPSTSIDLILEPAPKRRPTKRIRGAVLSATSSEAKSFVCMLCHMGSPQVYTWSWACLHPNCSKFWEDTKGDSLPNNLEYDSDFLKLMISPPIPPDFGKLMPHPPPYPTTDGIVTNYAFTRGFHCKSCGRLSCRLKWEKWECMNCGECLEVSGSVYKAKDFWSTLLPIGYKDHFINKISKIDQQPVRSFRHENGMGSIQSFILPDGRGKIHHIQPGTPLGRLEADDIFIEYQQQATAGELKFRRWPLRSHKCRGALLSNYFSQNSGEPYQYVGGSANTVPFENAPGAIVKARALIQKRLQQALEIHVDFNEVLSAAYMERQKMAFHSDNEIGLGPVVAGLSLGSPALMHFRIHAKHDPLREQKGNLLSFVLRHGDVLVMDGAGVQEYYEHTVIPNNFRIAATARLINPGHA